MTYRKEIFLHFLCFPPSPWRFKGPNSWLWDPPSWLLRPSQLAWRPSRLNLKPSQLVWRLSQLFMRPSQLVLRSSHLWRLIRGPHSLRGSCPFTVKLTLQFLFILEFYSSIEDNLPLNYFSHLYFVHKPSSCSENILVFKLRFWEIKCIVEVAVIDDH